MSNEKVEKKPFIICTGKHGRLVLIGLMDPKKAKAGKKKYKMENARCLVRWSAECGGLLGFAANGPKDGCKISPAVASSCGSEGIKQVLSISDKVYADIQAWVSRW